MKIKRTIPLLLVVPLLASCGPKELVIPTVDVDAITPTLPAKPTYNQGEIATDGTLDFIDFYELSDMHGAVTKGDSEIGLAHLAGYLNVKRSQNPGGTVVVSSGDMFQGSADSNLTRGYMVNYAMNYMGFDSMAIGNHEFDWTDEWIKKNANLAYEGRKIPFISANIVDKSTNTTPSFLSKSTIVERGGYKIGIIGSIGEKLQSSILKSCVENYNFTDEIEAVNAEALKLKEQDKCHVVVLTSHNDIENLSSRGLKNVDAIFGGHAHLVKDDILVDGSVPAAQTNNYGKSIAHIRLALNKETKAIVSFTRDVDQSPASLPGVKAVDDVKTIMSSYDSAISEIKKIKLGKCEEDLIKDKMLKSVCVEGMYQGALKGIETLNLGIAKEDILATFHNVNGGIRADISAGEITYNDVYNPFPFDNEIVLYKIKGSLFKLRSSAYSKYAVRREFSSKDEIDSNKEYYLVLTDFIALSDEYFGKTFGIVEENLIRTGKVVRDEVANLIYKKGTIKSSEFDYNSLPYKAIPSTF